MKEIKTANYKKAQEEVSYQELFNNALQKYEGDERQAAEFVLDMANGGTWAVWDQGKIDNAIATILKRFGGQQGPNELV